ncbi:hypothetical protein [Pseudomonas taiwanensis]|uniref:hypothetical protein n=1 Tax=Pseudomonas taiwanensis TaxID=470150 RepID=UPI0015B8E6D0|nr:hypothetical protein [Pseudomonas taiwanensis]
MKQLEINVGRGPGGDVFPASEKTGLASESYVHEKPMPFGPDDGGRQATEMVEESTKVGGASGARLFFPCNREDALILLGGLCISEFFPVPDVKLAIQEAGIALLEGGLRSEEEVLLHSGRTEKFPVLIEVFPVVALMRPRILEHKDVIKLWFRTSSEADEFKFRPVDEFDTETYSCEVDAALFGWAGEPRFLVRSAASFQRVGLIADRFAAGVGSVLSLGNARPDCRAAITEFLGSSCKKGASSGFDFVTAFRVALEQREIDLNCQEAIVSAFLGADDPSPRHLLSRVAAGFASSVKGGHEEEGDRKWLEVADAVIRNRIALTGDWLSDEKSILLRGTLLALIVDNVQALDVFLDAEKPAGVRVSTIAAFFVGLKQGVISTSWKVKKVNARQISLVAAMIAKASVDPSRDMGGLFSVSEFLVNASWVTSIIASGESLVEWMEEVGEGKYGYIQKWISGFDSSEFEVLGGGRIPGSFLVKLGSEHLVEISSYHSVDPEIHSIRFYLDERQKLRKVKDLESIRAGGSRLWYPGFDETGSRFLFCDIYSLPDIKGVNAIMRMLPGALEFYALPRKTPRSRRVKVDRL